MGFTFVEAATAFALEDAVAVCSFDGMRAVFVFEEILAALDVSVDERGAFKVGRAEGAERGRALFVVVARLLDEISPDLPKRAVVVRP